MATFSIYLDLVINLGNEFKKLFNVKQLLTKTSFDVRICFVKTVLTIQMFLTSNIFLVNNFDNGNYSISKQNLLLSIKEVQT